MIMTLSKTSIGAALSGVVGLCFLGYYILFGFDYIRNEKNKSNQFKKQLAIKNKKSVNSQIDMIFLQEVNMGEDYLDRGDMTRSVEHLAKAMVLCKEPSLLYKVLQSKLPKKVFNMLNKKLEQQLELSSSSNLVISNLGL